MPAQAGISLSTKASKKMTGIGPPFFLFKDSLKFVNFFFREIVEFDIFFDWVRLHRTSSSRYRVLMTKGWNYLLAVFFIL